ncbi:hypothetical protein QJ854_gp669 [Moumouvirus goulette]|uniref:Uncharacterized protein n=1 Tax=Moumouvirus goulette TaxID=1247379 RepID=M1PGI7_9VIRU|nr:hypothetical protein QJ854_gp669 [Moumouvirus goulette]AGF85113.1 hypothetical protein glt_00304 [Moumouvirus goulette]
MQEIIFDNLEYLLLASMLILILYAHYGLYKNKNIFTTKFIIITSAITFILMFITHFIKIKQKNKCSYEERVNRMKNPAQSGYENNAIELFYEIIKNPVILYM